MDNCPDCKGDGAHTACEGEGCNGCDRTTGNCPTCAGSGNNPERWMRYAIGRDGVFATLYDRQEQRLVVENATEEHCRNVRDQLQAGN